MKESLNKDEIEDLINDIAAIRSHIDLLSLKLEDILNDLTEQPPEK